MAATAQIDTNMNIMMPTINGVMRIGGEDLSISDNEMFRTLARKLMFKNKKEGRIDKMTVEGVIKDNTMEIFPFVLKVHSSQSGVDVGSTGMEVRICP